MVNRGLVLCLKNNITTADELAYKCKISVESAAAFINQNNNINLDELISLCEFFKVSLPYLLCITEINHYPNLQLEYASI